MKNAVIAYGYARMAMVRFPGMKGLEEVRVDLSIVYSSVNFAYPIFRILASYPYNTERRDCIRGEPSILLNEKAEEMLMRRSGEELLVERNLFFTVHVDKIVGIDER